MKHRIRAAAIVVEDGKLLLVKHQHPEDGSVWWVPPGGGIEGGESIFECARRETFEETGLSVDLDRVIYIREFVEPGYHHCELFILVSWFGCVTITSLRVDQGAADRCLRGHVRPSESEGRRTLSGLEPEQLPGPAKPASCKDGPVIRRRCSWIRKGST